MHAEKKIKDISFFRVLAVKITDSEEKISTRTYLRRGTYTTYVRTVYFDISFTLFWCYSQV